MFLQFSGLVDVADKARIMRHNKVHFATVLGKELASLNKTIEEEVALGVIELNGDNNKKKLDKSK